MATLLRGPAGPRPLCEARQRRGALAGVCLADDERVSASALSLSRLAPRTALRSARRRADALCVRNARSSASIAPIFDDFRSSVSKKDSARRPFAGATSVDALNAAPNATSSAASSDATVFLPSPRPRTVSSRPRRSADDGTFSPNPPVSSSSERSPASALAESRAAKLRSTQLSRRDTGTETTSSDRETRSTARPYDSEARRGTRRNSTCLLYTSPSPRD